MRWRTKKEVIEGKGQFICGEKRCALSDNIRTWEMNFAYFEERMKKNALVKLSKLVLSLSFSQEGTRLTDFNPCIWGVWRSGRVLSHYFLAFYTFCTCYLSTRLPRC